MISYDSPEFWEAWEERAAIMQFDAGLSREEAEKQAFQDVLKLTKE